MHCSTPDLPTLSSSTNRYRRDRRSTSKNTPSTIQASKTLDWQLSTLSRNLAAGSCSHYSHSIAPMATLSSITSMNGAATAHISTPTTETLKADVAPVSADHHGSTTLPADGIILAEATAYRTVDRKFLSHTDGMVVQQPISLKLVSGGKYVLTAGSDKPYLLDPADWDLNPHNIDQIVPTVHTLKAAGDTTKEVVLAGELEGEDLPLYDFEIKYRGGLKNAILHPNQPGAAHKLEEGQSKLVRLGFEKQVDAQEWYALLSIGLGTLDIDSPSLANLPKALAASKKARNFKA